MKQNRAGYLYNFDILQMKNNTDVNKYKACAVSPYNSMATGIYTSKWPLDRR